METDPKKPDDPPPQYEPSMTTSYTGYAPGQPQPYPPPQGYSQTAVIIQQPQSMAISGATYRYSQYPALIICQHCQATVTTSMSYETGLLTWAVAGAICLFGFWLGCCLIPFCINATKDVEHSCPNCKHVVGKFLHFS
jgi:lipopolysaccharide-induced tumor necrosis factor-alpha factor